MKQLKGSPVAQKILAEVAEYARRVTLRLDIVLVGHHEASQIYVAHKLRQAEKVGIKAVLHHLPAQASRTGYSSCWPTSIRLLR